MSPLHAAYISRYLNWNISSGTEARMHAKETRDYVQTYSRERTTRRSRTPIPRAPWHFLSYVGKEPETKSLFAASQTGSSRPNSRDYNPPQMPCPQISSPTLLSRSHIATLGVD